jgi:hypothetical protein
VSAVQVATDDGTPVGGAIQEAVPLEPREHEHRPVRPLGVAYGHLITQVGDLDAALGIVAPIGLDM